MKSFISVAVVILMVSGCSSAPAVSGNTSSQSNYQCPTTGAELDRFKTEQQVLSCWGKPRHETSKPDGRHTGLYGFKNGLMIVFLYDANGNVIRNRAYQDKNGN